MMARSAMALSAAALLLATPATVAAGEASGPAVTGAWTDLHGEAQPPGVSYRVRLFVHAAQACTHFLGEEPYDAERAAFLTAMIDDNCTGLAERRAAILADPATDADARALVETVWEPLRD